MRDIQGRLVSVNGRTVYVEESGTGEDLVVFEAGTGAGRTYWDAVLPLLDDSARLLAYDRAGRARTGASVDELSVDTMADDLVALVDGIAPDRLLLVGHSLGGMVVRRAAERLAPRLRGLLLVDPTAEGSSVYDDWGPRIAKVDRVLAVSQQLSRFRPVRRLLTRPFVRLGFSDDTVATMQEEDATPAGTAQTRRELKAAAAAIPQFRLHPPALPDCPVIVLSASRPIRETAHELEVVASLQEQHRRYAESVPDGRFESVDSTHHIPVEQPRAIADAVRELLRR
ncbi:MAG: alpha/beta hydrolase [Microbacterium sp.]|nr:alpha/beta hydrolase [Microbacterium sp.]